MSYEKMMDMDDLDFLSRRGQAAQAVKKVTKKAVATKAKRVRPAAAVVEEVEVSPEELAPVQVRRDGPVGRAVRAIESRFLKVTGMTGDLATRKITRENHLQVKTDKKKSDEHGEVFTPLWLVDDMLDRVADDRLKNQDATTRDLCAGYGQFSVRLIRRKYEILGEDFDLGGFLKETHCFVELQPNSCYRLMKIFGTGIRLCMGDATKLGALPDDACEGIWVWCEARGVWKDMTAAIVKRFNDIEEGGSRYGSTVAERAKRFEDGFRVILDRASRKR
jgi:hypothetical protein